jgi:hypothetical protein
LNPSFTFLINLLESVQRNFTKRIPSISARTYPERLALIGLELLELREDDIIRADFVYGLKIFNYLTPLNPNKVFLIYTPIAFPARSNSPYLRKPAIKPPIKFYPCYTSVVLKLGTLCTCITTIIVVAARLQAWPEKH